MALMSKAAIDILIEDFCESVCLFSEDKCLRVILLGQMLIWLNFEKGQYKEELRV